MQSYNISYYHATVHEWRIPICLSCSLNRRILYRLNCPREDGSGPGVKGEKERQPCGRGVCLLWGGVELTEATSGDTSLPVKELRRRGRVCQGSPIPTEPPHAAPPTLNTSSHIYKAPSSVRHMSPASLAMRAQSPAQLSPPTSQEFST